MTNLFISSSITEASLVAFVKPKNTNNEFKKVYDFYNKSTKFNFGNINMTHISC